MNVDRSYLKDFVKNNHNLRKVYKYVDFIGSLIEEPQRTKNDECIHRFDGTTTNVPPSWFTGDNWSRYQKLSILPMADTPNNHEDGQVETSNNQVATSDSDILLISDCDDL